MTPKVAVVQGLRPAPFGTLGSFFHERSGAAGGGANLKLDFSRMCCLMCVLRLLRAEPRFVGVRFGDEPAFQAESGKQGTMRMRIGLLALAATDHCNSASSSLSLLESDVRQHIWTPTKRGLLPGSTADQNRSRTRFRNT